MTLYLPTEWEPYENAFDFCEYYNNHEGTLGNYLSKTEAGTATITENAASHSFDCVTGNNGNFHLTTIKNNFEVGISPLILNFVINNINITNTPIYGWIGFNDGGGAGQDEVLFKNVLGVWYCSTYSNSNGSGQLTKFYPVDKDLLSIHILANEINFYQNNVLIASHYNMNYLPLGNDLVFDAYGVGTGAGEVEFSIDYLDIKIYR